MALEIETGWTDSSSTLVRWRVMRAMAKSARAGDDSAVAFEIGEALGIDAKQVGEVFDQLDREGLAVAAERRVAPGFTTEASLKRDGLVQVEGWEAATRSVKARACSSALLSWLDSLPENARTTTNQFLSDVRGSYFGEPFSNLLVSDVADELVSLGLIKVVGAMEDSLLLAELTPTGRLVLNRYGGDLEAWQAGSTSRGGTNISVYGSSGVNVANDSPHAHQTAVVSADAREQMGTLAAAAEQIIPTLALEPADQAAAIGHVAELRELAAAPSPSTTRAQKVVTALRDIVVNATGSATGVALVALADRVYTLL